MLKLCEASQVDWNLLKSGLDDAQAHPTPYDIYALEKLLEYRKVDFDGFSDYLERQQHHDPDSGKVPHTILLLFDDDTFLGIYDVRHCLNDTLRVKGGHIGYYIVPSYRRRGFGKAGLRLTLAWCFQHLGLDQVLLFCSTSNIASARTMEAVLAEYGGRHLPDRKVGDEMKKSIWLKTTI